MDFEIISQKCSLGDLLSKLLKWFSSAEELAVRAKNRKKIKPPPRSVADFKIISQKCSLGDPQPKLLK